MKTSKPSNSEHYKMLRFIYLIFFAMSITACYSEYKHTNMTTMSDVYFQLELDSTEAIRHPMLDTIKGLAHYELKDKGYYIWDSCKFDMIAVVYMDTIYPSQKIQSQLFKMIDSKLFDGFMGDTQEGDSLAWSKAKPYLKNSANEFIEAWRSVLNLLTHKPSFETKVEYYESLYSLSFVACHKVHEDLDYITYIIECGNESHGGCGCRNKTDYITFNKQSGEVITIHDIVNNSNNKRISEAVNVAYKYEYMRKMEQEPSQQIDINEANGVAILNEGIVFYYYPYAIGCGAEGQYNLVIEKLSGR